MKILENKTRAKNALFAAAGLMIAGAWAKFSLQSAAGVFAVAVGAISALFCVKKLFSDGFLEISGDGWIIRKGGKEVKFSFEEASEFALKTIEPKSGVKILIVKFKALDKDKITGLMQPVSDDEAAFFNSYEKSIEEIKNALNENFRAFKRGK